MGARHKLNVAYLNGSLLVAVLIGFYFESWLVCFVALAILLTAGLHDGSIRPGR